MTQAGFTLAELMLGCVVTGLAMAGLLVIQRQGQVSYLMGASRVETQQNARAVLDLMTRELRTAIAIISMASATDVTYIWMDAPHTIRYRLDGTDLKRTDNGVMTTARRRRSGVAMTCRYEDPATGAYVAANQVNPSTINPCTYPTCKPVTAITIGITTKTERNAAAYSPGDERATVESTVTLCLALL